MTTMAAKPHNKELASIFRVAKAAGWRIEGGGQKHYKCFAPDGQTIVVVSSSPSRGTGLSATRARLRRAGLEGV